MLATHMHDTSCSHHSTHAHLHCSVRATFQRRSDCLPWTPRSLWTTEGDWLIDWLIDRWTDRLWVEWIIRAWSVCWRTLEPVSVSSSAENYGHSTTTRSPLSLSLSVCLSTSISQKPLVQTSTNSLCILPVAVAQSWSGGVAMRYVLPVGRRHHFR